MENLAILKNLVPILCRTLSAEVSWSVAVVVLFVSKRDYEHFYVRFDSYQARTSRFMLSIERCRRLYMLA